MPPDPANLTLADLFAAVERLAAKIPTGPAPRWLTVQRSAVYCDLSVDSIRHLVAIGKLTAHRPVKGRVLIDKQELDALILASTSRPRAGRGIRTN